MLTNDNTRLKNGCRYDAIVIGTGLTGSWAAKELSEAGLHVLVVDAGPLICLHDATDTISWDEGRRKKAAVRQPIQSRHPFYHVQNPILYIDDVDHPYTVSPEKDFVWIRGRQVGGRSLTWGGVALRFSDFEFQSESEGGPSPNWPITSEDLAPWYERVERFLLVRGAREQLPQLPDGCFIRPGPMTSEELDFKKCIEARWPMRRVINCRGIPVRARNSLTTTLFAALATNRADILPNSVVSHLIPDSARPGVKGVVAIDRETHETYEIYGKVVALCASTIESVRILLNSRSPQHPGGIGNSSGCLGKYLMDHPAITMRGSVSTGSVSLSPVPMDACNSITIPRYVNLGSREKDFLGGFGFWGSIARGRANWARSASWFLTAQMEVPPRADNCVTIDPDVKDSWGIPSVRISLSYGDNEAKMKASVLSDLRNMIELSNLVSEHEVSTVPGEFVHEVGGARMGNDPTTSVINRYNQCWDASNLYVMDGSAFVTSGWQNPSLTMMALAARASAAIVDKMCHRVFV